MSTDLSRHLPDRIACLRAVVASIPVVGAAFDHLLFDKADAIRFKNLEAAIAALSDQLCSVQEGSIDKRWFQTEEALASFKMLADKVSYEADLAKVTALGRVVAACGNTQHSLRRVQLMGLAEPAFVLTHIGRLAASYVETVGLGSRG